MPARSPAAATNAGSLGEAIGTRLFMRNLPLYPPLALALALALDASGDDACCVQQDPTVP